MSRHTPRSVKRELWIELCDREDSHSANEAILRNLLVDSSRMLKTVVDDFAPAQIRRAKRDTDQRMCAAKSYAPRRWSGRHHKVRPRACLGVSRRRARSSVSRASRGENEKPVNI